MNLFSLLFRYKDKDSPDKLGRYPENFHVSSFPERRYLWTSRILVICSVFSICFNIALTSIIYLLTPQKTSSPVFFNINEASNTLDEVLPINVYTSYNDLLTEGYIFEYINMRHSIPRSTADLYYRWDTSSKFYWYSSIIEYYKFVNKIDKSQIMNFIRQQMKRTVEIDYIKKINRDFWTAQFRTTTSTKYLPTPDVIIWRAYIRVKYMEIKNYEDIEKTEAEKMNYTQNPFGFKVMSYITTYAGKPEKSLTAIQTAQKVFENLEDVVK